MVGLHTIGIIDMQIRFFSDLHYGINLKEPFEIPKSDSSSVLVLAGDVCDELSSGIEEIKAACDNNRFVIFVPGNHEYHSVEMKSDALDVFVKNIDKSNFILLNNSSIYIDNTKILGATLWSNIKVNESLEKARSLKSRMRDFKKIIYDNKQLTIEKWQELHEKSVNFLERETDEGSVIVTHFLPSYEAVHEDYKGSEKNIFFASNMEDLMLRKKPKLWLFGHTHYTVDRYIHETRILSNPYGYRNQGEGIHFNPHLSIHV